MKSPCKTTSILPKIGILLPISDIRRPHGSKKISNYLPSSIEQGCCHYLIACVNKFGKFKVALREGDKVRIRRRDATLQKQLRKPLQGK